MLKTSNTPSGKFTALAPAVLLFFALGIGLMNYRVTEAANANHPIGDVFLSLQLGDPATTEHALGRIEEQWQRDFIPFAIDSLYLLRDRQVSSALVAVLERKTGQTFGLDTFAWWQWAWQQAPYTHPAYGDFKSALYGSIDPAFAEYFGAGRKSNIRLEEILWGGVRRDGIPPLRNPKMIPADQADYLDNNNVVFGISINGDARAYPQRILAWHEMFVDEVGGKAVAGVY